jgi:hypothetical protein
MKMERQMAQEGRTRALDNWGATQVEMGIERKKKR